MQNFDLSFLREILPQLVAAAPLVIAIIVAAWVLSFISCRSLQLVGRRTHLMEGDLEPFLRILRWIIRVVALALILSVLGFEISGLWGMFSTVLAMVAIGFVAVWSVLSNVSCTVIMLISRPFNIGDELEIAGEPVKGRVVDLNFVHTTLKAEDGRLVQIPNNLFFQKVFHRRLNPVSVTLASQLSSQQHADV